MTGLFILVVLFFGVQQTCGISLTVNTTYGKVTGFASNGIIQFKGIPYAQPPRGPLRFASPVPPTAWAPNILPAMEFKFSCPQVCKLPTAMCPTNISEDCLYMNIFVPLTTVDMLPVMVFIYGGAYYQGTSNTPVYSPISMVKNSNTILVTFDYRLGAFGFLVNDEVRGNFAIQDQRMVLQFVKDNIKNFGGDPNKVTLFGESAGAMSTVVHLISPLSKGLFQKVILQSDPFPIEIPTPAQSLVRAKTFSSFLGCSYNDMVCMRGKSMELVLDASFKTHITWKDVDPLFFTLEILLPWRPVLDPQEVPMQIFEAFRQGSFEHVPIMIGTNTNEGVMFVDENVDFIDNIEYSAILLGIYKLSSEEVLNRYPVTLDPFLDTRDSLSRLLTHYLFACPARYFAQLATIAGGNVWVYHFDYFCNHCQQFWGTKFQFCWAKVCHGSELPFVFNSWVESNLNFTVGEQALSTEISTYWTNFAHTSDPNSGQPVPFVWPPFNGNFKNIKLGLGPPNAENYLEDECNFWDKLGYSF